MVWYIVRYMADGVGGGGGWRGWRGCVDWVDWVGVGFVVVGINVPINVHFALCAPDF